MMQIPLFCGECIKESLERGAEAVDEFLVPIGDVQDSLIYEVTCEAGHTSRCVLQHERFEVLFELGFNAIIDKYNREAVASFTAALERFYEFFIRLDLSKGVDPANFERSWRSVQNQSERQLGAFIFLYLKRFGVPAPVLSQEDATFRNRVIHKGYIPSRAEALAYGETVRTLLSKAIRTTKESSETELLEFYNNRVDRIDEGENIDFGCTITPIIDTRAEGQLQDDDVRNQTMEEIIPMVLRRREPHRLRLFKTREELEAAKAELEAKRSESTPDAT